MTEQLIYDIGDLVMSLSMVVALIFAFSYGAFFNWRSTSAGRSLMYFVLALVLWAGLSTFTRFIPDYWGRPYIRLAVYLVIFITITHLVVTLWRHWRDTPQSIQPRKEKP